MRDIEKKAHWLGNVYRYGVPAVKGYVNADSGLVPRAPLIHSYNPNFTCIAPSLAIAKPPVKIPVEGEDYLGKHFRAGQKLDRDLCTDDGGAFRPTVKPHYVIAPESGPGKQYNERCPTMLLEDDSVVHQASLPVHSHDRRLSPATSIQSLKAKMLAALKADTPLFLNSFVVDEVNKQILITQHCLLTESEHDALLQALDNAPTLEALASAKTPIQKALELYDSTTLQGKRYLTAAVSNKPPIAPEKPPVQDKAKPEEVPVPTKKSPEKATGSSSPAKPKGKGLPKKPKLKKRRKPYLLMMLGNLNGSKRRLKGQN